jgi:Transposase DDE domain
MHKKRLITLTALVETLLLNKRLSVTGLGRSLELAIQERSGIRRADRFIGNKKIGPELEGIYGSYIHNLIGKQKRPPFIIDWSQVPNTTHYVLRAALVAEGRALTLYEEVHPEKKLSNAKVEKDFLDKVARLLPTGCKPIIITDAGFRSPWFKKVLQLGWDFLGRVRGTRKYYDGEDWQECKTLLSKATSTAKCIGQVLLCKRNPVPAYLYLLKEHLKKEVWRKKYKKRKGKKDTTPYRHAACEGWLLASSLSGEDIVKVQRVIKLYKKRMQIEEGFRDLKDPKYGFGLRYAYSKDPERIKMLLLIAMFASLIAWLTGYVAEKNGWQYQFQANSTKGKRVLSFFFLGCQVIKRKIKIAVPILNDAVLEARRMAA